MDPAVAGAIAVLANAVAVLILAVADRIRARRAGRHTRDDPPP